MGLKVRDLASRVGAGCSLGSWHEEEKRKSVLGLGGVGSPLPLKSCCLACPRLAWAAVGVGIGRSALRVATCSLV